MTWRKRRDRRPKHKQDHPIGQIETEVRFSTDLTSMRVHRVVQISWLKRRSSLLLKLEVKELHKSILLARRPRTFLKQNEEVRSLRRESKKRLALRLIRIVSHVNRNWQVAFKQHSNRCSDNLQIALLRRRRLKRGVMDERQRSRLTR